MTGGQPSQAARGASGRSLPIARSIIARTATLWVALWVALWVTLWAPASARTRLPEPRLAGVYPRWLASVDHLANEAERQAFRGLSSDTQRELFIHRFWAARGATSPARAGGALARWHRNFDTALDLYESLDDDRARAVMVSGAAPHSMRIVCDDVLERIEIWTYDAWHAAYQSGRAGAQGFTLLFYRDGPFERTRVRQWAPEQGAAPLLANSSSQEAGGADEILHLARAARCLHPAGADALLEHALGHALGPQALRRHLARPPVDAGWLAGFRREIAELPASSSSLPGATLEIRYPGRYNDQRTILEGHLAVPTGRFGRTAFGQIFDRVTLEADLHAGDRLKDTLHADYYLAGMPPEDGLVRLTFYRRLRPGTYSLDLRAVDGAGLALARETRTVRVPRMTQNAVPPAGSRRGFASLTRSEVGSLLTFPSLELLPAGTEAAGPTELRAVTSGGPIDRVGFFLDGVETAVDHEPPWSVELDLGREPQRHTIRATALDGAGRLLGEDHLELNATPPRFAVRVGEVEGTNSGARRVDIEVDVPAGEQLAHVDVYLNDQRVAVLRQPPFSFTLPPALPRPLAFVRAVAVLASGVKLEDLVIVEASVPVASIDVALAEVYVSVVDGHGRPVTGLGQESFTLREDGEPRPIVRFDTVAELAIDVGLLMDTSASMRRGLNTAARSARRFFETVIGPRDQALLVAFNHRIDRLMPFTGNRERLRYATAGLRAWGTTRLRDAIIYTLYGFGGQPGRRALVVLTDGQDVDSDFDAQQVLAAARRAGVAVYPVLLAGRERVEPSELETLALETGGRFFAVATVAGLDRVYQQIEAELRAQYLLVYQPATHGPRRFRRIAVSVAEPGLRARTISGYHP